MFENKKDNRAIDKESLEPMYSIIFFNDDVTNIVYVQLILMSELFQYSEMESIVLIDAIEKNGSAEIEKTTMEKAYQKVDAIEKLNEQCRQFLQTDVVRCE